VLSTVNSQAGSNIRGGDRKAAFLRRISTPDQDAFRCPIPGCGRPSQARAGKGASPYHCKFHIQRRNRHGSFWKTSYKAAELLPYRRAAERWIKTHLEDAESARSLQALRGLLANSGPVQDPATIKTLPPRAKARGALARLRRAEIPPERLLAIVLAVSAAVREDPIGPGGPPQEYRRVQIAKAVHRLASGQHRVGEKVRMVREGNRATIEPTGETYRFSEYPRSSGQALRHLGRMLDECCAWVLARHLAAVVALKVERYGARDINVTNGKANR
jgi:hypothetical protein